MAMPTGLARRVIPAVLLDGGRLVKGVGFSNYREAGLAKTTLRVLNAQDPDELLIVNISQTKENFEVARGLILEAIKECDVPITVGGRIHSLRDAELFFRAGAEKVLLTSAITRDFSLVEVIASRFGSQAVVAGIEYLEQGGKRLRTRSNGSEFVGGDIEQDIASVQLSGAGEMLCVSVSRDGGKKGLDLDFLGKISPSSPIPVIGMGGVGNFFHLAEGFLSGGLDAVACGTLFTFGDNNPIRARAHLKNQEVPVRS